MVMPNELLSDKSNNLGFACLPPLKTQISLCKSTMKAMIRQVGVPKLF